MRDFSTGAGTVAFTTALIFGVVCLFGAPAARATGTILIQQADGQTNVYHDVVIKVIHSALYMTSSDGRGTLVINRAACAYQRQLLVCLPTSATLVQSGQTSPLDFKQGTLYVNSTDDPQQLSASTQKVDAHGIVLSFTTKRGTYVNLNGRIDKVVK
ncbi:MAG: hypothetical protein WB609_14580 [Candidatus Cybelea sp.]